MIASPATVGEVVRRTAERLDADGILTARIDAELLVAHVLGLSRADLVVDGKSSHPDVPESDFRLSRFAEGHLLTSPFPYVGAGEMR